MFSPVPVSSAFSNGSWCWFDFLTERVVLLLHDNREKEKEVTAAMMRQVIEMEILVKKMRQEKEQAKVELQKKNKYCK